MQLYSKTQERVSSVKINNVVSIGNCNVSKGSSPKFDSIRRDLFRISIFLGIKKVTTNLLISNILSNPDNFRKGLKSGTALEQ